MSEAFENWWRRESPLSLTDKATAKIAYHAGMEECIGIIKAGPFRHEALGGQMFKYIQVGELVEAIRATHTRWILKAAMEKVRADKAESQRDELRGIIGPTFTMDELMAAMQSLLNVDSYEERKRIIDRFGHK